MLHTKYPVRPRLVDLLVLGNFSRPFWAVGGNKNKIKMSPHNFIFYSELLKIWVGRSVIKKIRKYSEKNISKSEIMDCPLEMKLNMTCQHIFQQPEMWMNCLQKKIEKDC